VIFMDIQKLFTDAASMVGTARKKEKLGGRSSAESLAHTRR